MMLELIMNLLVAGSSDEKECTYERLERWGIDRTIADAMAAEFTD